MSETHEPQSPLPDYPKSHVYVEDVFLEDCDECTKITIHGVSHYLHRTTAFSLYEQLQAYFRGLSAFEKELLRQGGSNLGKELY